MIAEYAESLAARLSFDRALARRVRQEVEDHLWEAVAADPKGGPLEAERRAIARFGDPQVIAAQFAAASLARQTRNAGAAVILVIAGVFIAMKARLAWYGMTQWSLSEEARAASATILSIDRGAFWLALGAGIAAWAYIGSRRTPAAFHPSYGRQLRRFFFLCAVASGGLAASVAGDVVLTALRLSGTQPSADFLIPVFSVAIELACAALLALHVRGIVRRAASVAALPRS